jgi:NADH-quinone oxidoreductase subunit L
MRNMGGMKDRMPVTFWVYTIGSLALAGIFPFAGFWSKDEILVDALETGGTLGPLSLILLVVAAGFTAFYMGRQVFMIFFGEPRTDAAAHAHESPRIMTYPLVVLAFLSVVGGLLNLPGPHPFGKWLEKSVVHAHTADFNIFLALFALAVAGAAIYAAYFLYHERPALEADGTDPLHAMLSRIRAGGVWTFLHRKWYWDEVYANYVVAPFNGAADYLGRVLDWELWHDGFHEKVIRDNFNRVTEYLSRFDLDFIDGIVNGLGGVVKGAAGVLRYLQTGYVRNYALGVLIGTVAVLIILLLQ